MSDKTGVPTDEPIDDMVKRFAEIAVHHVDLRNKDVFKSWTSESVRKRLAPFMDEEKVVEVKTNPNMARVHKMSGKEKTLKQKLARKKNNLASQLCRKREAVAEKNLIAMNEAFEREQVAWRMEKAKLLCYVRELGKILQLPQVETWDLTGDITLMINSFQDGLWESVKKRAEESGDPLEGLDPAQYVRSYIELMQKVKPSFELKLPVPNPDPEND